jgi:chemotaxis protein CheC
VKPFVGGGRAISKKAGIMDASPIALSEMERDALAELANMGMHRAAATLRQMVREQVLLSIPTATIIPREIAAQFVQENSEPQLIAVQQSFDGSFSGQALLIFPQTRSLEIVRSILGDKHSFDDIVTMEHEVLAEAGNIILNAFLGTLANVLGQTIRMSLPSVIRGNGATLFVDRNVVDDLVLVLYVDFIAKDRNIKGFIALLMDLPAIATLKAIVRDFTKSLDQ